MIADPVEESFPFTGNTEFVDVDSPARLRVGQAETFRQDYIRRLASHREAIAASGARPRLDLMVHRTDRPATEALARLAGPARCQSGFNSSCRSEGRFADVRHSARFHLSFRPRRARGSAAFVFSAAHHAAAPGARALSAPAAHFRSSPTGRDRLAHALVAAAFASHHRGLPHIRDGGTRAEPAGRRERSRGPC